MWLSFVTPFGMTLVQTPALEAVLADQDLPAFRAVLDSFEPNGLTWIWMRSSRPGSATCWTDSAYRSDA